MNFNLKLLFGKPFGKALFFFNILWNRRVLLILPTSWEILVHYLCTGSLYNKHVNTHKWKNDYKYQSFVTRKGSVLFWTLKQSITFSWSDADSGCGSSSVRITGSSLNRISCITWSKTYLIFINMQHLQKIVMGFYAEYIYIAPTSNIII